MNAKLEIYTLNTPILINLNNVLVEQFQDGIMITADGVSITIYNTDIASMEISEEQDSFFLKNNAKIVLKFT